MRRSEGTKEEEKDKMHVCMHACLCVWYVCTCMYKVGRKTFFKELLLYILDIYPSQDGRTMADRMPCARDNRIPTTTFLRDMRALESSGCGCESEYYLCSVMRVVQRFRPLCSFY